MSGMPKLYRELAALVFLTGAVAATGCATMHEPAANASANISAADRPNVLVRAASNGLEEEESHDWSLTDFTPSQIGMTVKRLSGRGPNRQVAQQLYAEAESFYRQALTARSEERQEAARERFLEAATRFAGAADRWPDSALEEDALFHAGESQFHADRYVKANTHFEQLVKKYPNTRYLDLVGARRFVIAQYWLQLQAAGTAGLLGVNLTDDQRPWIDTFGNAVRVYDRMRLDDPTGKLADDATIAAANALFARGEFQRADQYYTDLRLQFPSSEHQFQAHYLGIQAKLRSYQGPEYTGETLDEAEKLITQVRRQFPQEARQHEQELDEAYRRVRFLKAQREWNMAQYYSRRQEYGAARLYYDTILADYTDTPFAEKTRSEVLRIAERPLSPPQRFSWLVDLFPDGRPAEPQIAEVPGDTELR